MTRVQTIVQLNQALIAVLDREAGRRGISRSALIREALESHFKESKDRLLGEQLIAGYSRIPAGRPDEWGNLEELGAIASAESLAKLRSEESEPRNEP